MSALSWLQIVQLIVAEFEGSEDERERLTRKFHEDPDYEVIRGQYSTGASVRRVRDMIRRTLNRLVT